MLKAISVCGLLLCSFQAIGMAEAPVSQQPKTVVKYKPEQQKIIELIISKSKKYDVSPALALAVAEVESSFNPDVTRYEPKFKTYSVGLFQMFLPTARSMGFKGDIQSLKQPKLNTKLGIKHILQCINRFGAENIAGIACCHNAGPYVKESVCKNNTWVKDYIRKVKAAHERWKS